MRKTPPHLPKTQHLGLANLNTENDSSLIKVQDWPIKVALPHLAT
jgi:hypothetical protein